MRKVSFVMLLLSVFAFGAISAQNCGNESAVRGCIGDNLIVAGCQTSYSVDYTVVAADVDASPGPNARLCLIPTGSSLCPNTSALASVLKNGQGGGRTIDLNDNESMRVNARLGDVLTINVVLEARNNGIQCIRLGETTFALVR